MFCNRPIVSFLVQSLKLKCFTNSSTTTTKFLQIVRAFKQQKKANIYDKRNKKKCMSEWRIF